MVAAFAALEQRRATVARVPLRKRFDDDPGRFKRFSLAYRDLLLDYSRNLIDEEAMRRLVALAEAAEIEKHRAAMFTGEPINRTEGRPALHAALRSAVDEVYRVDGRNVVVDVHRELERMTAFASGVRSGEIAGVGGPFTDVVTLGHHGSDLGPRMAIRALHRDRDWLRFHFVSGAESTELRQTLAALDPERSLVFIAARRFTTVGANAAVARRWIAESLGEDQVGRHFAAASIDPDGAAGFGIAAERAFRLWDWVGRRHTIWSAIGLPLMMAIGPDRFAEFLSGGRAMDDHFRAAPFDRNMPVILALIGVWYRNVWGFPARAILPFEERLDLFPAYLQQLDMELNGKRVRVGGATVMSATGPLLVAATGNGVQAFRQILHQGTDVVPCDFLLGAVGEENEDRDRRSALLAACLAESEALMRGRTIAETRSELAAEGLAPREIERLAAHCVMPGNRPSNTLLFKRLTPSTLGMLIALYEHKVFVEGIIWGVNSFDQSPSLGEALTKHLVPIIEGREPATGRDASTSGLVDEIRLMRS